MMQIEKGVPTSDLNPIRTHIDRFKGRAGFPGCFGPRRLSI